jgi:hypothetical protein
MIKHSPNIAVAKFFEIRDFANGAVGRIATRQIPNPRAKRDPGI